ncbi:hypothetical protein INT47_008025 [Mucor saturninus]|uniref:Uncharacterized protein n=1 Tax=Mucor saturninus TaxID=64648 RepID=A0A8H7R773_9FUNG|nr:hypothetical protein INT47_008025 [Mucor saturninus]
MKKLFKLDADEQAHYFRYFFLTTKLTIDRDHERMTFDTSEYLDYQYSLLEEDDLEMLPKLQVVHLNNSFYEHYYFGITTSLSSFGNPRNRISDQTIQNLLRDIDMSKTNSRLKILQLHIPNLPISYFQYVSEYLVPHLDSLDLQINRSRMQFEAKWIRFPMSVQRCYGNPELVFVFTRYALIHCPNLQTCSIVMDAIFSKTIYISTHVKELQLRKDCFITSKYGKEDIKMFKSFHLIPSQATLDLLCINLPNIQVLTCGANFMYGRWTQKLTEIDLKVFKNLELFQFDDYNICADDTDYIFIRLQVDNEDMAYYSRRSEKTVVYETATLQLFQKYQDDATLNICLLTVKCNSGVKFIVSSRNHIIAAEFDHGHLLDHICIGSKIFHKEAF